MTTTAGGDDENSASEHSSQNLMSTTVNGEAISSISSRFSEITESGNDTELVSVQQDTVEDSYLLSHMQLEFFY